MQSICLWGQRDTIVLTIIALVFIRCEIELNKLLATQHETMFTIHFFGIFGMALLLYPKKLDWTDRLQLRKVYFTVMIVGYVHLYGNFLFFCKHRLVVALNDINNNRPLMCSQFSEETSVLHRTILKFIVNSPRFLERDKFNESQINCWRCL